MRHKAVLSSDALDLVGGTDGGTHPRSPQTQDYVHHKDDESHHGRVARVDEAVEALSTHCGELDKSLPVRVHVENPIDRDDVSRRHRLGYLDKVAVSIGDAIFDATPACLLSCRLQITRGGVDTRDVRRARGEKLMLDRANSAADVEHSRTLDTFGN
jgi:hypothetical protein